MPLNSENEDCRGFCSSIDIRHFPGEEAQQWAVHDPGKILLDVALAVALGGDCLADVAMLRAESAVFGPVASDPTVSRLIGTLAAGGKRALAAIRTARAEVREGAWKLAGISAADADGQVIVDLDGVLVIAHSDKQDAAATWKKTYGHHPLMGLVDHGRGGSGEPVVGLLRPGNAGSRAFPLIQCVSRRPGTMQRPGATARTGQRMPGFPLAVKASSKSGIAVRCGVRGDDAGAGLMPPFPRALEASVKSGAARRLRGHHETRVDCSDVDRYGASPLQGRPLVSSASL
jgi:hypothetical protein